MTLRQRPAITAPKEIGDIPDDLSADDFAKAIEQTVFEFKEGDIVGGTVVRVDPDEVLVERLLPIVRNIAELAGMSEHCDFAEQATTSDGKRPDMVVKLPEGRLIAIDLRTGEITALELSPAPYHVTTIRGTGAIYVSSRAEPRIWVVDQNTLERRNEFAISGIGHQMALATN